MKLLLLFTVFFVGGCGTSDSSARTQNQTEKSPASTETKEEKKVEAAECKICAFDFKTYKGDLSQKEVDGLLLALNDEYMAIATYEWINDKFDNPRPFVNIVRAETRHASRLKRLFEQNKIPVPENPWKGETEKFETVQAACKASVDGEIANVELYDRLLKSTERDDILTVYRNLRRASEENHKPAFERCGNGRGNGNGRGRGGN